MQQERIDIWGEDEYSYSAAFGFRPNFRTCLHQDGETRPCVLVIPGGGYRMVVPSEGEIVAKCFFEKGYQTFVGTYTTNFLGTEPLRTQPLEDISRMVRLIRVRADEFRVDPERIVVCGFSAGAHLCGSLGVHWKQVRDERYPVISNRPDGVILSYPVITSGEYAHRDSFVALLGEDASEEELNWASLEKNVTFDTSPMFLWQTVTDETVPVENSYLMAMALNKAGISFEHHVFPRGRHGLSIANEDWAEGRFGEPYTMEQLACMAKAMEAGTIQVPPDKAEVLKPFSHPETDRPSFPTCTTFPEVMVWPELADRWMKLNLWKQELT